MVMARSGGVLGSDGQGNGLVGELQDPFAAALLEAGDSALAPVLLGEDEGAAAHEAAHLAFARRACDGMRLCHVCCPPNGCRAWYRNRLVVDSISHSITRAREGRVLSI